MCTRTVHPRWLGVGVLVLLMGCNTAPPLPAGLQAAGTSGTVGGVFEATLPRAPVAPPPGLIYSSYRAPLAPDVEGLPLGTRTGRSSTLFIQEPFLTRASVSFSDASVAAAMHDGGITTLTHLDYEVTAVLGVFGRFTVIAHGN